MRLESQDSSARNYRIVDLARHEGGYTVVIEQDGARRDTGTSPSAWGAWGLTRRERGILRRGLTPSGRDRRPW